MILEYLKLVGLGLVALLPVANPLTSATLLLALSKGYTRDERNRQVDRATIYVAAIILVCFYAGNAIMSGFGISIPGLRIAGGLIVAYIGFSMLFPDTQTEAQAQVEMAPDEPRVQVDAAHGNLRRAPRAARHFLHSAGAARHRRAGDHRADHQRRLDLARP